MPRAIAIVRGGCVVGVYGDNGVALTVIDYDLTPGSPLVWTEFARPIGHMRQDERLLAEGEEAV
jgi:hypothetical protein